ncbi:MAG: hypothetical protein ABI072_08660 [Edaphobacter sp.]
MRRKFVGRWVGAMVLLAVVATLPTVVAAQIQGEQRGGGGVFAGGQMVRGTVTVVAENLLTVKTDAGEVFHVAISANTRLTKERQPVKVADIKVGDGVGAMGVMDAPTKTVHAVFVAVMGAEQVKKTREGMGKLYITGKVTAVDMDALKVTVLRPDGVSQVIGVDEGTSFRRGGRGMAAMMNGSGPVEAGGGAGVGAGAESITLADVKVGDRVAGKGGLKNGVFVPSELGVMDASAMGQRRRRGANGGGTSGAGTAGSSGVDGSGSTAEPK